MAALLPEAVTSAESSSSSMSSSSEVISECCFARIGLMGNPSDGFGGKTVSALIGNFHATCTIRPSHDNRIHLKPHPLYDPTEFMSLDDLSQHTLINGYYGGMRLLQATCRVFFDYLCRSGLKDSVLGSSKEASARRGFVMSYDTTIPRCVGLSGSSAIIVAAFRCLLKFHGNLTLADLGIPKDIFPSLILSIEKSELKISAGLQDRVIQTYGGLVHMDFTERPSIARAPSEISVNSLSQLVKPGGVYTPLDPSLLPCMYLAYNVNVGGKGGDSGTVHSTVKERWEQRDPELIRCMQELGSYADMCVDALREKNFLYLGKLMQMNFAMRRRIYGDEVVGLKNIAIVDHVWKYGMGAKFPGSGGAILCMRMYPRKDKVESSAAAAAAAIAAGAQRRADNAGFTTAAAAAAAESAFDESHDEAADAQQPPAGPFTANNTTAGTFFDESEEEEIRVSLSAFGYNFVRILPISSQLDPAATSMSR